jgi:hypothetical protein
MDSLASFLLAGNLLHGCLFLAFLSLEGQIVGLVGPRGLSPVAARLRYMRDGSSSSSTNNKDDKGSASPSPGAKRGRLRSFWMCPTFCVLFRNGCSAASLRNQCRAGIVISLLGGVGILPHFLSATACAVLYLSLVTAGGEFMALQWDSLAIEASALYAVSSLLLDILPFSSYALGLARFSILHLLFRLIFCSGVCKLASGCPKWGSLTAMQYHYWTQPLPHIGGWLAYNFSSATVHKMTTLATLFLELTLPLLMFVPGRGPAVVSTLGIVGLMLGIMCTGSYGFFNVLAISICAINAHHFGLGWTVQHEDRETPESAYTLPVQIVRLAAMSAVAALLVLYNLIAIVPLARSFRIDSFSTFMDRAILSLKERIVNPGRDPSVTVGTIRAALHRVNSRIKDLGVRLVILDDDTAAAAAHGTTFAFKNIQGGDDAPMHSAVILDGRAYTPQELLAEERQAVLNERSAPEPANEPSIFVKYTQCALRTPVLRGILWAATLFNSVVVQAPLRMWAWALLVRMYIQIAPLHLINPYGLFARMTTHRYEIVLERSTDGIKWTGVPFRSKPGRVWEADERLPAPTLYHLPRLDWRLWFLPLDLADATTCLAGFVSWNAGGELWESVNLWL